MSNLEDFSHDVYEKDPLISSTGFNTEILLWTIVECCVGLVCACLPCMTPLGRLVTIGPIAAFSAQSRKRSPATTGKDSCANMLNINSRPWRGGRRLPSVEDSRTIISPGAGRGHGLELDEWLDRRDVMNDGTTRSEPERQWLEGTLPDPTIDGFKFEMQNERELQTPNSSFAVAHTRGNSSPALSPVTVAAGPI
ncbi:MAG: hypothetical protein Q9168_004580 [Polycauliona sp. 1 TL-2023]